MEQNPTTPAQVAGSLEEPVSFIRQRPVRLTIYAGLILFLAVTVIWPLIAQLRDPNFKKHIAEHRVMVGMSKQQVLQAWGGPFRLPAAALRRRPGLRWLR